MKEFEMVEMLENNGMVIKNVKFADGTVMDIEEVEGLEGAVAFEVVSLEEFENNGYDVEGCSTKWVDVQ